MAIPAGPRVMKMADYFAASDEVHDAATDYKNQADFLFAKSSYIDRGNFNYDQSQFHSRMDPKAKVESMEREVLDNVNVNFLFARGENLHRGLIDGHRLE